MLKGKAGTLSRRAGLLLTLIVSLQGSLHGKKVTEGTGPTPTDETQILAVTKLVEGVYTIRHRPGPSSGGNTTVVIGDKEVFVVDSSARPSSAREDVAQIRRWTTKPVRYLLNTHWHGDHNTGNYVYADAFPGLGVIAQVETKRDMDLINPGLVRSMGERISALAVAFSQGKDEDGTPLSDAAKKEAPAILATLARDQDDFKDFKYLSPNITFVHTLNLDLGNQEVQVRYLGRGNTAGDAIAYLPKEKILITGDLLVHPVPYLYDGYPSEWIRTLHRLAEFDAGTIVPGHGPVLHDKSYLYLVRDLLVSAVQQLNAQIPRLGPGVYLTLDQIKGNIDLTPFRQRFAGENGGLAGAFDQMCPYLVKIAFNEIASR